MSSGLLTPRFLDAVMMAMEVHGRQRRTGTEIPYLAHLLVVTGLVIEDGGDEDEAIAALLHDAVEDGGGRPMLERIQHGFGADVATIVDGCTDNLDVSGPRDLAGRRRGSAKRNHVAGRGRGEGWARPLAERGDLIPR
jgi:(p)ppGpp synthase/HD superfamily hydrolase